MVGKKLTTSVVPPSVACQLLGQSFKPVGRRTGSYHVPFQTSRMACLAWLASPPLVQLQPSLYRSLSERQATIKNHVSRSHHLGRVAHCKRTVVL
jgi:hypothetical protein